MGSKVATNSSRHDDLSIDDCTAVTTWSVKARSLASTKGMRRPSEGHDAKALSYSTVLVAPSPATTRKVAS